MRFLLLNQYFRPDLSAVSQMMTDLAEDLAATGAKVTVITGQQSYTGETTYPARETWEGIEIIRVPSTSFGRDRLVGRAVDHATFLLAAAGRMLTEREVDVVVAISTPPFLPVLGLARKWTSRTKFVYWVQDLFPDAAIRLGVLGPKTLAARGLELVSRATLRGADAVITIGDCMAERIAAKGIPDGDIDIVHNWADGTAIHDVPHAENWFRRDHDLASKFVVLYSGNLGRGHAFDTLLESARALAPRRDVVFLFIGGGARRQEVQDQAGHESNVRFLPYQAREHLAWSLGAADLAVITLQDEAAGVMVPSKLYGHMASSRPILYIGPASSTVAQVITETGCGAVFSHGDVPAIVDFIAGLSADPDRARAMGAAGRRAFEARFDRWRSTERFLQICNGLSAG